MTDETEKVIRRLNSSFNIQHSTFKIIKLNNRPIQMHVSSINMNELTCGMT